jgi:Rab GDP dissociation inhibitor
MEDTYDCVILGTGLTECVLSGLLSVEGNKVLVLDRNDYQGEDCASLTLEALCKHMGEKENIDQAKFGRSRDYNIDLIPKFLMAKGKILFKQLIAFMFAYFI